MNLSVCEDCSYLSSNHCNYLDSKVGIISSCIYKKGKDMSYRSKRIPSDIPKLKGIKFHTNFDKHKIDMYKQVCTEYKHIKPDYQFFFSQYAYDKYNRRMRRCYALWDTGNTYGLFSEIFDMVSDEWEQDDDTGFFKKSDFHLF